MTETAPIQNVPQTAPAPLAPPILSLDEAQMQSPERFFNREVSWLAFNQRVLEEAQNPRHPLLERLRYISISANNLDEFYMVRVAGLKGQVREGVRELSQDGLSPNEQLDRLNAGAATLMKAQQERWRELRIELQSAGIKVLSSEDVDSTDRAALSEVFQSQVFPVLTPMAIDPAHPFPFIPNLAFSLALKLRRRLDGRTLYALVPVPQQVRRFWRLPPRKGRGGKVEHRYLTLEGMLVMFFDHLFPGCDIEAQGLFRLLRDSDVEVEEEAEDLVREFEALLRQRRLGSVVNVTFDNAMNSELRDFIIRNLHAEPDDVVVIDGDGMGRAFPEVQMTTFFIYGAKAAPAAIADEKGNVVVFKEVIEELTGSVASQAQADVAQQLAQAVKGVHEVDNLLVVVSPANASGNAR